MHLDLVLSSSCGQFESLVVEVVRILASPSAVTPSFSHSSSPDHGGGKFDSNI